jgi:hypothetical protein
MAETDELTPDEIEEFAGFTQQEIDEELSDRPAQNPAVFRCVRACNRAARRKRAELGTDEDAEVLVAVAAKAKYLRSMPPLDTWENVRDFIACVTFAEVVGLILHYEAENFLSSAKVALAAVRHESKFRDNAPKRLGRPPKSAADEDN